ncbi:Mu transposase C-terminal domain-containing protein [Methylomicrobium lacus]|uniref:Mu transposase C-terminal domain-containing protein n=1 Tax=Methylomicrobium lacus TaxID=136992 RepID=UPI0035A997FA
MSKEHDDDIDNTNPAYEPIKKRVDIQVGSFVQNAKVVYRITQILDFETVIGVNVETGRNQPLRILELTPLASPSSIDSDTHRDLDDIVDDDWNIAEKRFAIIKPLLDAKSPGRKEVELHAKSVGIDTATLYRWINKYQSLEVISTLIPKKRGWRTGNRRIAKVADAVIDEVIQGYYFTSERPSQSDAIKEVHRICELRNLEFPHASTIRRRLLEISEKDYLKGCGQKEKAKNKFTPVPGKFPNADFPLAVIQIDHTPVDVILVDDVYRKPIGRPWLTVAIDVYSRMIAGYYLSFDPPSGTSVAMCVAHAILPKKDWLILHNVEAEWPVWGVPKTIHVDNGADFRSNSFQRSCLMYGINLEFRPVKQPHYGGHIERLLGTFSSIMHTLPGTTFSSIEKRKGYDSEKEAVMTKDEFERWLVKQICKIYHPDKHNGIGMPPIKKWTIGIFGNAEVQGVGLPPVPSDRLAVLLDFLPSIHRSVQRAGVVIDYLQYYDEALRPWINVKDPDNPEEKLKMIFRRDPRDISALWFYDPTLKQYFKIPFADQSLPAMSIWEHNLARAKLKQENIDEPTTRQILRALTELRNDIEESKSKTKKARRMSQRRIEHEKKITPAAPLPPSPPSSLSPARPSTLVDGLIEGDIDTFGDIS